jgi:hypothetical protein
VEDQQQPFDPYAPPQTQGYEPPAKKMSSGAKAICIIALILGVMGMAKAVLGGVGLVVGSQAQQMFSPPQPDKRLKEMQEEMQAEMNAIADRFLPFSIARVIFHLIVATLLVVGGIIMLKSNSPTTLIAASALAIFFEIGRAILDTTVQMQIIPVMSRFIERMGNMGPDVPGGLPKFITYFSYIMMVLGLFFVLAKIIFYVISVFVLRKSKPAVATP